MRWHDDWLLLPERFALHESTATAVLADVHLGYSAARQRLGDAIPSCSVREEIQPLLKATSDHSIRNVVVAGDLFERGYDAFVAQQLLDLLKEHNIHLLALTPGNHDRGLEQASASIPIFSLGFDLAGWRIVHGDQASPEVNAISGHWHPALRLGRRKVPCFLARDSQLILPAFSLDAAGVDVAKDPRWRDWQRFVIDRNEVRSAK